MVYNFEKNNRSFILMRVIRRKDFMINNHEVIRYPDVGETVVIPSEITNVGYMHFWIAQ